MPFKKRSTSSSKKGISIGRDVVDSVVIAGDNNIVNYFKGDYVSLKEYYIPPDSVFQRVRTEDFVGRDWLTVQVDAFLNDPQRKSGAFLLIGDAGVGKTSFMAHLVKERGYLHLFAEQVPGQALLQRAIQSLASQLVTRYQIDPYKGRDTLIQGTVFPDFLERLLRMAAGRLTGDNKIVIVCDALDEAGTFPDGNVCGLPNVLPDGVYLILSQRPVNVKLPNIEPLTVKLEAQGTDNLQDMDTYLGAVAQRAEVAGQLRAKGYSDAFFIQTLKEKSLGVWMYLHYAIKEIAGGSRTPLELAELPTGLVGYYAEYWHKWRIKNQRGEILPKWNNLYAPLLSTLAAAQDAITVERLTQWAQVKAKPDEVKTLLSESWRAFVTEKTVGGKKVYAPYHLSFRDFITGKVDLEKLDTQRANLVRDLSERTVAAHARIVHAFETECGGQWEKLVAQEYPRLHLCTHLNGAGEYEKLRILLTEGDEKIKWAEARERKEETYAGYLNDLRYVWDYGEREQNYALAIRCMLIENSIHSLASNIPPELLAELAKTGIWSYARCLEVIRQKSDSNDQIDALCLLAPEMPSFLFQEVLTLILSFKDEYQQSRVLATLIPHLNDEQESTVLSTMLGFKDESAMGSVLFDILPLLKTELRTKVFESINSVTDGKFRTTILEKISPSLDDEQANVLSPAVKDVKPANSHELLESILKTENDYSISRALIDLAASLSPESDYTVVQEILSSAIKIRIPYPRIDALIRLIPYLNEEHRTIAIQKSLLALNENYVESQQPGALVKLAPYLDQEMKLSALSKANDIQDKPTRSRYLAVLSPYLSAELRSNIVEMSLALSSEINDEFLRSRALSKLLPFMDEKLKEHFFEYIQKFYDESARSTALEEFAPYFSEEQRKKALIIAFGINDTVWRANVLSTLSSFLDDGSKEEALQKAIAAVSQIGVDGFRVKTLMDLAPKLTKNLQPLFIAAVKNMNSISYRVSALAALIPFLGKERQGQVIQSATDAILRIDNLHSKASAYADLAAYLGDAMRNKISQDIMSSIGEIDNSYTLLDVLTDLAPYLHGDLQTQALQIVSGMMDRTHSLKTLARFVPYLDKETRLNVIQKILDFMSVGEIDHWIAGAFIDIASYLDRKTRIRGLIVVFQKFPYGSFAGILSKEMFDQWREIGYEEMENHIFHFIKLQSTKNRHEIVEIVGSLAPALIHFSGQEIVPELYRAIQDTARWWP